MNRQKPAQYKININLHLPDEGFNLLMISTCSSVTDENPTPLARWADKEFIMTHDDI